MKNILILFLVIYCNNLQSQNYLLSGDAVGTSPFSNSCPSDTCFTLTPDLLWQQGAVYNDELFDLTLPFDGTFCLFLGTKDANGADGFAFILKDTNVSMTGLAGGSIGYGTLSPSIAIEFDTWDNGGADIPADHTSLNYNGNSFVPVVPSISLLPSGGNVEDGMAHTARIVWTPHDTTIYMFFDNSLRFTHKVDLRNTIFGGATKVNWGFTSSTGGSSNLQQICFPVKPINTFYDTTCLDSCINFNQIFFDINYNYSWSNGITDTFPSALLCPNSSSTYFLYKESKLTRIIDTISVFIEVENTQTLDLGVDLILCKGSVFLDATISNGIAYLWSDGSQFSDLSVSDTGLYWAEARTKYCVMRDSISIKCNNLPNVFSPNGDGMNDYFSPFKEYEFTEGNFLIYNRWGSIVLETSDIISIKNGWDGQYNNKDCTAGVYYFTFSYKINNSDELIYTKGALHLFR
ncbi:gliding motility-associated C-terminal domain-containing protein [Flavobacteriales bacterium]|nr:gliding motility-associated C-terminal domain-containing protein [Flavobacteriales bacterium]